MDVVKILSPGSEPTEADRKAHLAKLLWEYREIAEQYYEASCQLEACGSQLLNKEQELFRFVFGE